MTTATASYNGSNGAAMAAATGTYTMGALVVDGTTPPVLSVSLPYNGSAALRWAPSTSYGFQDAGTGDGYFRTYIRIIGTPTGRFVVAMRPYDVYTAAMAIGIDTDRKITVYAGWGSLDIETIHTNSTKSTGATAIPSDQWVRIEGVISGSTVAAKMWLSPSSSGTPDVDISVSTSSALFDAYWIGAGRYTSGAWTTFAPTADAIEVDEFAFDTAGYPGPLVVTQTANAAASETASGTAAAVRTRVLAGTPSITAGATAVAGLVITADGAPSITATGSADAAVLTTHNAEAASIITVGTTDTLALTQGMVAASTITAGATAVGATNTAANGAVQAIGAARAVVEGETSPGFLYATVAKNILTN